MPLTVRYSALQVAQIQIEPGRARVLASSAVVAGVQSAAGWRDLRYQLGRRIGRRGVQLLVAELRHAGGEIGIGEQPGAAVARTVADRRPYVASSAPWPWGARASSSRVSSSRFDSMVGASPVLMMPVSSTTPSSAPRSSPRSSSASSAVWSDFDMSPRAAASIFSRMVVFSPLCNCGCSTVGASICPGRAANPHGRIPCLRRLPARRAFHGSAR